MYIIVTSIASISASLRGARRYRAGKSANSNAPLEWVGCLAGAAGVGLALATCFSRLAGVIGWGPAWEGASKREGGVNKMKRAQAIGHTFPQVGP